MRGVGHGYDDVGHAPRLAGGTAAAGLGTGPARMEAAHYRRGIGRDRRGGEPMAPPGARGRRGGPAPSAASGRPAQALARPTRAPPRAAGPWRRGSWLPWRPVDPPARGGGDRDALW